MEPLRPFYGAGANVPFMKEESRRSQLAWEPAAAFVCFAGSVLSLLGGFVFTTGWILDFAVHPFLHGLGLTLLIIGIPLLILGAHFLDMRERKIKKSNLLILLILLSVFSVNANAQPTDHTVNTDKVEKNEGILGDTGMRLEKGAW